MQIQTEEAQSLKRTDALLKKGCIDDRACLVALVRRWGGSACDAVLDPHCSLFGIPSVEGLIGYRLAFGCAIAFGDPVCAAADIPALTRAFHSFCKERGCQVIYVAASEKFANWAIDHICKVKIAFGEELTLDPHYDPRTKEGVNASLVRRKVRHALREETSVKEYLPVDEHVERAIEQVGQSWLQARKGPQIHISRVRLFDDRLGKRWFYAKQGERLVGTVLLNQIQAGRGWLLNHLMITPDAPHGTPELLVVAALEALCKEGCHHVTFGSVPAEHLGEIVGLSPFSTWLNRQAFKVIKKFLRLDGRRKFWEKFHAQGEKSYLLFGEPRVRLREALGLMRAMHVV